MRQRLRAVSMVGAACVAMASCATSADVILTGGPVYTMVAGRMWAEAVAVRDGRFIYVGNTEGAMRLRGSQTKVVDTTRRLVLPGFIDTHNHAYLRAEAMFWMTFTTPSLEAYTQAARDFLAKHPDAQQIRGVGFDMKLVLATAARTGRRPSQLLDELVGRDIPAVIITNGHHQIWANTRAMQNAKVTSATPDPPGAFIDRDAAGEPTGIFREFGAQNLVIEALPQPDFTVDQYRDAILSFQKDLAGERGVTAVLVPVHYPTESFLSALQALDADRRLTVRYDILLWADETRGPAQIPGFIALREKYKGTLFRIDSVKFFGTGSSGAQTSLVWKQDVLEETIAGLDKAGFRVYIHDIGPVDTYERMLDALEHARAANGARDARHAITHVLGAAAPIATRFKTLGIIADGHPAPKAFFDAGVLSTTSSDYPVRDFFPMPRIAAGVKNGIPLDAMIASHTLNGAFAIFAERDTGSIEVGKSADLVVMDQNIFELPVDILPQAKVLMTMFQGREVFRDMSFTQR